MRGDNQNEQIPEFVDLLRLAKAKRTFVGKLALAKMTRLGHYLANNDGIIDVVLEFGQDIEGFYYIKGELKGALTLICQRCMQPMELQIEHAFNLSPVWTDVQAKTLPERFEPVMLTKDERFSLVEMLEDELILQLPVLPKHDEQDCSIKLSGLNEQFESTTEKPNPFAVLAALKNK